MITNVEPHAQIPRIRLKSVLDNDNTNIISFFIVIYNYCLSLLYCNDLFHLIVYFIIKFNIPISVKNSHTFTRQKLQPFSHKFQNYYKYYFIKWLFMKLENHCDMYLKYNSYRIKSNWQNKDKKTAKLNAFNNPMMFVNNV